MLALWLALAGAPVQAAFHLVTLDELYSNADGTIQFLEIRALTGGQQFFGSQVITVYPAAGGQRAYTFPNDLPGDTTNRTILIATQGFANLGIVTPDYVVPNGFFAQAGGLIDFAGADAWTHGALPTDNRSIDRNGTPQAPTPKNFAGVTGTVPASPGTPTALNFQGLWWSGEAESGWGLNIAHQGDVIFMTWFTYDADGSAMWLVASDIRKTTGNTFTGTLRRTTGPAYTTNPFPANQVQQTVVGSATFTFTDANTGRFDYTVNGVTQFKNISRLVFDPARVPVCTSGGTGTPNLQDLWIPPDPAEQGWGVNIVHQGDILFATWFTYNADRTGQWFVMSNLARQADGTYNGVIQATTGPAFSAMPFNPNLVVRANRGSANFNFNVSPAIFTYTLDGVGGQVRQIQRFVFANPPTICR